MGNLADLLQHPRPRSSRPCPHSECWLFWSEWRKCNHSRLTCRGWRLSPSTLKTSGRNCRLQSQYVCDVRIAGSFFAVHGCTHTHLMMKTSSCDEGKRRLI